jgi:hypothetical protein
MSKNKSVCQTNGASNSVHELKMNELFESGLNQLVSAKDTAQFEGMLDEYSGYDPLLGYFIKD